jgi:Trp operon repressor
MKHSDQLKIWAKRRKEIYREWMKRKKSQRQIAREYGVSNTRIAGIIKYEELTRLDK